MAITSTSNIIGMGTAATAALAESTSKTEGYEHVLWLDEETGTMWKNGKQYGGGNGEPTTLATGDNIINLAKCHRLSGNILYDTEHAELSNTKINASNENIYVAWIDIGTGNKEGDKFTISFDIEWEGFEKGEKGNVAGAIAPGLSIQGSVNGSWNNGSNPFTGGFLTGLDLFTDQKKIHRTKVVTLTQTQAHYSLFGFGLRFDWIANTTGLIKISNIMVVRGETEAAYKRAPEDDGYSIARLKYESGVLKSDYDEISTLGYSGDVGTTSYLRTLIAVGDFVHIPFEITNDSDSFGNNRKGVVIGVVNSVNTSANTANITTVASYYECDYAQAINMFRKEGLNVTLLFTASKAMKIANLLLSGERMHAVHNGKRVDVELTASELSSSSNYILYYLTFSPPNIYAHMSQISINNNLVTANSVSSFRYVGTT